MTSTSRRHRIPEAVAVVSLIAAVSLAGCDEAPDEDPAFEQHQEGAVQQPQPDRPAPVEEADGEGQVDEYADVFGGELRELPTAPETLDELPEGVNVVQYEMRLLTAAMQNILQLIADERLDEIPDQIRQVHPVYELTHEALEQQQYRPPVNPDRIDDFVEMDDEFHDDLRGLVGAANDADLEGVTEQYGRLVDGCASCHGEFRFP